MTKLILSALTLALVAVLAMAAVAAACPPGVTCEPPPDGKTITLTGTIRDFKSWQNSGGHSDFGVDPGTDGYTGFQVVYGLVEDTLGSDGTPDLNSAATNHWTAAAIRDEASFEDWYKDNTISKTYEMTLTEKSLGSDIYVFAASPFFPIDNELGGNEGLSHNYLFTLQLHTDFTYTQMQGRTLDFYSDDDLWVFIDNELVVDLGGVHAKAYVSVPFDDLGLSETGTHTFDLFFAERHTIDSQLCATAPVPELPAALLLSLGMVGMLGFVWMRKRHGRSETTV